MPTQTDELFANAREHESRFKGPRAVVPARHVAIVTCMDSRIDTFSIFGLESGEAHILRNAGGLVTDDVLRSLVLSQTLLETREIILMHHTNCGIKFDDVDEAVRTAIRRVREHPALPHRDNVRGFVYEVEHGRVREVT
jgi:carbonic anhydrase